MAKRDKRNAKGDYVMTHRRYIQASQGMPVREITKHELFDTKQIAHTGQSGLVYFVSPYA